MRYLAVEQRISKLAGLLEYEARLLSQLLELLLRQRKLVPFGEMEDFKANLAEQERLMVELDGLEARRLTHVQALATQFNLPPEGFSLEELIKRVGPEYTSRLHCLRRELKHLVQKIIEVNQGNQYLIGRSLDLVRRNLQLLLELELINNFYGPSGKPGKWEQRVKVIDRKV